MTAAAPKAVGAGTGAPAQATDPGLMEALREEVRAILASPAALRAWRALSAAGPSGEGDPRPLYRLLGAYRLLAPAWPAAYGGRSLSAAHAAVVVEEIVAAGIPDTPHTLSVQICGNFLLSAGTPAQRASVLPMLAAGRQLCTVLYTEPDAGSDLAGLTARAAPAAGGTWRITGRKIYSVRAGLADLGLVAARTSKEANRYQGLTLFLVPMKAPGVTVRDLASLADETFADVRLDEVLAGPGQVIGPIGGAWPLIAEALALERTGVDHVAKAQAWLRLIVEAAAGLRRHRAAADGHRSWAHEAGRLSARTAAARAISRRCLAGQDGGHVPPVLAAATKLWCSETAREIAEWGMDMLGEAALWRAGDPAAVAGGRLEAAYREAPGLVISAGTSEMMRELVASTGLTTNDMATGGEDGLFDELRNAVRAVAWAGAPDDLSWGELAELGVLRFGVDPAAGGLGLGEGAHVAVCLELGACGYDGSTLDTLTVVDAIAAAHEEHAARAALPDLLEGSRRGAVLWPEAPARPATDPGETGLLLVLGGLGQLWKQPSRALSAEVLGAREPLVSRRARATSAGHVVTLWLQPGAAGDDLRCGDAACRGILARDLRRRAAWLIGAGAACVSAAARRARSRRQFGKTLLEHQAVAHRLADLAAQGEALRSLLFADARLDGAQPGASPHLAGPAGLLAEAGRFARKAVRDAIHIHGASGMVRGSPVERAFHAVPLAIARGPAPDVLDLIAASPLLPASGTGPAAQTGSGPET